MCVFCDMNYKSNFNLLIKQNNLIANFKKCVGKNVIWFF